MNIGKNIKKLRLQVGITQEQLASQLGVSFQAVSKWETDVNTPDISLLPQIAKVFHSSIDALFQDDCSPISIGEELIKDDDVIRVIQFRGRNIIHASPIMSADIPPIEIAFPTNCNEHSQYFKVEVYGHLISDGSINGDVICHQSVKCGDINGSLHCDGNIQAHSINSRENIVCKSIAQCYDIRCNDIDCGGDIQSANVTARIIYRQK